MNQACSSRHTVAALLLLSLVSSGCTKAEQASQQALVESSGGIGEEDVDMDVSVEADDTNGSQEDTLAVDLDVLGSDVSGLGVLDTESGDPDARNSGKDVECPIFVPVDEPDFGKPTQPPSSYAPCSPDSPCTDGEYCTADFYQQWEGSEPYGNCVRLCFHPKSDTPSEMGCDATQFCVAAFTCIQLSEDSECDKERGVNVEWKAWCGPKNCTRGGLGGNWDYSQCPCDHPGPGMTPEEKATCEEAWADMQNQ